MASLQPTNMTSLPTNDNDISSPPSKRTSIIIPTEESETNLVHLRQLSQPGDIEGNGSSDEDESGLPPPDRGRQAWMFLVGCFFVEALVWGMPFSFGVFETFYSSHPLFYNQKRLIAIIGTCQTGGLYLLAPISISVLEAWPALRRFSSMTGLAVLVVSLVASSFAAHAWHLIFTQGVFYAIGGSLLYTPLMFYLDEWFVHRKGLAFGIMWAGGGTAGVILPFILTPLLIAFGFRTTLRALSMAMLILCAPLIYFVRPRLPVLNTPIRGHPTSYAFVKSRTFIFYQLASMLESLGYGLPFIFLPSYAQSIGLSRLNGTLVLSLLNAFYIVSAVCTGWLCDILHVTTVIAISTAGSTLSVFLLWGFATNLPPLAAFAVAYGTFAGGFSTTWSAIIREVREKDEKAKLGMLGLLSGGRGVSCIISGPLAGALLRESRLMHGWILGYGTEYGPLILLTGISASLGLVCFGAKRQKYGLRRRGLDDIKE